LLAYGALQNQYVQAGAIMLGFIILAKLSLFIFNRYLQKISAKTETKIDDLIFEKTRTPIFYLILAYGLKLAIGHLQVNGMMTKIVSSVMALVFVLIISRVLDIIIESWGESFAKKTETKLDEVLLPILHKAVKVVFVVIAFMWVLDVWEIDITPYLAGVGISGLVLGLALQDSLKNVFGGVTLLLDKTYQIGDKVKLESGDVGTIHDIGLRSTKLVTFDNEVIYIPNGYLANARVQNYNRPNAKQRVHVNFGVDYGTKIEKVHKVVFEALKKIEGISAEPKPSVDFVEMGDFALKFTAYFWVENYSAAYGRKLKATEAIYDALNKAKIGIPFPTQMVYVKKGKK